MNHEERHSEAIAALLAGGLDPDEAAALEAQLHGAADAQEAYAALKQLAAKLEAVGDDVRAAAPVVDLMDDVLFEAELVALGDAENRRVPVVDLVEDVLTEAHLMDLGDAWREEVPQVNLVDDVLMTRALEEAGDAARRATPEVNLVDDVMRSVRRAKTPARVRLAPPRDELAARRKRRSGPRPLWLGLAAAACLLLGLGLILLGLLAEQGASPVPQVAMGIPEPVPPATEATPAPEDVPGEDTMTPVRVSPITIAHGTMEDEGEGGGEPVPGDDVNPLAEELTLRDILLARANALAGTEADRELLANWASLTAAQARALLAGGNLTREEALGLSLFLPDDEAMNVLLAQLRQNPEDPYLRLAMAKTLEDQDRHGEAMAHLTALQRSDEYNGLSHFMEARLHLEAGNLPAAIASLERAAAYDTSYAYAGTTARARAAALEASGLRRDEAQLLAAITAGAVEYEYVRDLAGEMLQYGLYYESVGDYDSAAFLYDSVEEMGAQVADGAGYINERIAGLETQEEALGSQLDLAAVLGSPDTARAISDSLRLLQLAWGELEGYLAGFNDVFATAGIEVVNAVAETVLAEGDFSTATREFVNSALPQ